MTEQQTAKKNVTPPKGRPTRARNSVGTQRRAFGPAAQWVSVTFLIALLFVLLIVLFDGGDFNPFNDPTTVSPTAAGAGQPSP